VKQLPGRQRPRWITVLLQGLAAVVATIWLASLLPYLLLMALVVSLMLIPTLRRLRKEAERTAASQPSNPFQGTPLEPFFANLYRQAAPRPMVDVTPPHRKLIRAFWLWRQQR
jgi:hypothetical protein